MKNITIRVESVTPLLMNSPQGMIPNPGPTTRKSIPSPADEAEMGAYRNVYGNLCFPTAAFRGATLGAAKGRKVGRSFLTSVLAGSLFPYDEMTNLMDTQTGKPLEKYEVDTRRCVLQGKSAIMRSRPKINQWTADVHFEYDEEFVDEEIVREMLAIGGRSVGVGNYRPEKRGPFGRFSVVEDAPAKRPTTRKR